MKNIPSHFVIPVRDLEKSIEFYTKLGCSLLFAAKDWAEFAFADHPQNLALRHQENESGPFGGATIGFNVEDCEATIAELREKGFKITTPPYRMQDGKILGAIKDPDGNGIYFVQPPQ